MSDNRPVLVIHDKQGKWSGVVREAEADGTKWLALTIAEMLRVGLAAIARRYPEARGKTTCPHCGKRG